MRGLLLVFLPTFLFAQSQVTPARDGANLPDWIMAFFTVALTALAGAQFWAMYKQGEYTRDGLVEAKRAARAAASAAEAAASASATAKMTMEIANRANVGIESIILRDPWPAGSRRNEGRAARSYIEVVIKNYGATRAEEMSFEFRAAMPPYIEKPVPIQPLSLLGNSSELHTLCCARSASKSIHEMCSEFFSDTDLNLFLGDLRVDGHVRYKDLFGNGYCIECSATFDPVAWQFETITRVRSEP